MIHQILSDTVYEKQVSHDYYYHCLFVDLMTPGLIKDIRSHMCHAYPQRQYATHYGCQLGDSFVT